MRIIARFAKGADVKFVSHLDVQRLFQRAMRRADLPIAYSNGFNPHPLLSFATALSVGYTSEAEWLDIKFERDITPDEFKTRLNRELPTGFNVIDAMEFPDAAKTLTAMLARAEYAVRVSGADAEKLGGALIKLLSGSIVVNKRTKAGMRDVDIRPMVLDAAAEPCEGGAMLKLAGTLDATGSLNVELFMESLFGVYGEKLPYSVHRTGIGFVTGEKPAYVEPAGGKAPFEEDDF